MSDTDLLRLMDYLSVESKLLTAMCHEQRANNALLSQRLDVVERQCAWLQDQLDMAMKLVNEAGEAT